MSNTFDPYANLVLDEEEQALEASLERGEFESVKDFEEVKKQAELAAKRHIELQASKPITLRVKQADLIKIKAKAKRSNIPYQTLLGALLHDFAENKNEIKLH
ncbi:MAG: hypothetical protein H6793_01975 [Candidatus Nomurabacteria bacterium]|nr:MAG: hypothetical protein H6793_01975 [Candidatus Nomurabacteria bacterium]